MHLKRNRVPKNWPIKRKGTKYVISSSLGKNMSVPLLIVLRDFLKVTQNRKEVRKAIHDKLVLVNDKEVQNEKKSMTLLDTLTLVPEKKSYRLDLTEKGKFTVNEIPGKEAGKKISKITNKKILRGKKIQLNLSDGKNFLSEIKCNVGDSVVINFKDKKIGECIPLKEKSNVLIFSGKHAGKTGSIKTISKDGKIAEVSSSKGDINVLIKQIMAVSK